MRGQPYRLQVRNAARRAARRLAPRVQEILPDHYTRILNEPHSGEQLGGPLRPYRSDHFRHEGAEYRIAYEILEEEELVVIYHVGTRAHFYEELGRRLRL